MFKKYLLLSCAVAMLSACGGGKDLDYGEVIIATPTPTPEPDDIEYRWKFDTEEELDDWIVEWEKRGTEDSDLYFQPFENALGVVFAWGQDPNHRTQDTWTGNNWDYVQALATLDEPMDLRSGMIYMSIYYPTEHITSPWANASPSAHHLGTQYVLKDADGNEAMLLNMGNNQGWINSFDQFNEGVNNFFRSSDENLPTNNGNGVWTDLGIEVGYEVSPTDEDLGFDLSRVTAFGVRFNFAFEFPNRVNPDDPEFNDEIYPGGSIPQQYVFIDNVAAFPYQGDGPLPTPTPEPTPPQFTTTLPFEDGLPGWSNDGKPTTLAFVDGAMQVTPDWSDNDQVMMYVLDAPNDYTGAVVTWVVDIPAEYVGAGISFQPYLQQNSGSYSGDFSAWIDASTIVEGENVFEVTFENPPADIQRIGLQMKGENRAYNTTTPIVVKSVTYPLLPTRVQLPLEDGLAGWSTDGKPNSLEFADGSMDLTPAWSDNDQIAMYVLGAPADFTGATVTWVVDVPAEYVGAGISFQPYLQQNDGSYTGDFSAWVDASTIVEGENTFEITFESPPENVQRIGLQVKGENRTESPASPLSITSVSYTLPINAPELPIEDGLAGWSNDGKLNTLTYADGVMEIGPDWGENDQVAMFVLEEPGDFTGAIVTWVVDIPAEYVGAGISLQPYLQQNSGSYSGDFSAWIDSSTLEEGENTFEVTFEAPPADVQRIGIQLKGENRTSSPTSPLVVKKVSYLVP